MISGINKHAGEKTWQKFALMNVGLVLGLFASPLVIPSDTSFWWRTAPFGVVLAAMNCFLFARLKKATGGESKND